MSLAPPGSLAAASVAFLISQRSTPYAVFHLESNIFQYKFSLIHLCVSVVRLSCVALSYMYRLQGNVPQMVVATVGAPSLD